MELMKILGLRSLVKWAPVSCHFDASEHFMAKAVPFLSSVSGETVSCNFDVSEHFMANTVPFLNSVSGETLSDKIQPTIEHAVGA